MYYNSNTNNSYYNAYQKDISELEAQRKDENIQKIIQLLIYSLMIFLFSMSIFYLYKYFDPLSNVKSTYTQETQTFVENQTLPIHNIIIREEDLPLSIQKDTITSNILSDKEPLKIKNMNEEDIALIVKLIMSQINAKSELPLEVQLEEIAHKTFLDPNLKQSNHYNKVILPTNSMHITLNTSLQTLTNSLNEIIEEDDTLDSTYSNSITEEILIRENEMRIIIVQNGDTLSDIAQKAYGNKSDYSRIFTANPEIIKNPHQIFIGQRLRIPS